MTASARPLDGLLVVSMDQAVAAPYCGARLADAGARVIKVERPEGDFARGYDTAVGGLSTYFVWLNRGKESLTANIKDPDDAAMLHRMIDQADVFIQNLAPGAAARAGFDSEALRKRNPRLVTVDISGYGVGNPYEQMKAYDMLIQAETGLASLTGTEHGPGRVGVSVCDITCGMTAYTAVLEALLLRERTGEGRRIEVSLFGALSDWMNVPVLYYEGTGTAPKRLGLAHPSISPYGAFDLADGSSVLISIQNEREWADLCREVLLDPDLPSRPGFETNNARVANRPAVDGLVAEIFGRLSREEAATRLDRGRIAYGFINQVEDLVRHPALRRAEVATETGVASIIAPGALHDGATYALGRVPAIGEHTEAIRKEFGAARG